MFLFHYIFDALKKSHITSLEYYIFLHVVTTKMYIINVSRQCGLQSLKEGSTGSCSHMHSKCSSRTFS
jgi:hypothetical protein